MKIKHKGDCVVCASHTNSALSLTQADRPTYITKLFVSGWGGVGVGLIRPWAEPSETATALCWQEQLIKLLNWTNVCKHYVDIMWGWPAEMAEGAEMELSRRVESCVLRDQNQN